MASSLLKRLSSDDARHPQFPAVGRSAVSQSAKSGPVQGECFREKSSSLDWITDEPPGKPMAPLTRIGAFWLARFSRPPHEL